MWSFQKQFSQSGRYQQLKIPCDIAEDLKVKNKEEKCSVLSAEIIMHTDFNTCIQVM
jgi:hypothetical protein